MGDLPQTLADLRREVFGESAATRAARAPLRPPPVPNSPAARGYNERRARARAGAPAREDFARFGQQRQAFAPPRDQIAELPQIALEMTGLPSVRRSAAAFASGDPQGGAMEGFWGAMGVGGLAVAPRMGPRAVQPRMPVEPPQRLTPPPREIGPNGMPIAPRRPFRNSLRGGSADLAEAAAMRRPETGGYRTNDMGLLTYDRPTQPPQRLYHGTTADVSEFAPGSHFGTAQAANRRLADNAPNAEGARVYAMDAPQGNYLRVPDAGDAWGSGAHWVELARTRSPANSAEAALYRALRRDETLPGLRGEELYTRLDQHFRDNGFVGALYANRFEGGESVFLPGRTPSKPPDWAKTNRNNKPASAGFLFGRRR